MGAVGKALVAVGLAVRAGDRVNAASRRRPSTARRPGAVGKALVVVGLAVRGAGDRIKIARAGAGRDTPDAPSQSARHWLL